LVSRRYFAAARALCSAICIEARSNFRQGLVRAIISPCAAKGGKILDNNNTPVADSPAVNYSVFTDIHGRPL
jgi:hypothetical protein